MLEQGQAPKPLAATISISRKINLGNYESADVFISVGGITHETAEEDVVMLLDGPVKDTFAILRDRLAARINESRKEGK
jgi:hypothetical protein